MTCCFTHQFSGDQSIISGSLRRRQARRLQVLRQRVDVRDERRPLQVRGFVCYSLLFKPLTGITNLSKLDDCRILNLSHSLLDFRRANQNSFSINSEYTLMVSD